MEALRKPEHVFRTHGVRLMACVIWVWLRAFARSSISTESKHSVGACTQMCCAQTNMDRACN